MRASFKVVHFSLLLLVSVCSSQVFSEVYQITSSSGDPCPRDPCLTLSQFTNQTDSYLNDNITLIFQPGNHSLNSVLSVSHITMLSMYGTSSSIVILCNGLGRFDLSSIPVVHVGNLTFIGCPGNKVESIHHFTLEYSSFIGQENAPGTALELIDTSASLCNSTFISNCGKEHKYYGGAILSARSNINITKSWFEGNHAQAGGAIYAEFQSNITITNSAFIGNFAKTQSFVATMDDVVPLYSYGGGVLYVTVGANVIIHNSLFINNSAGLIYGGVVYALTSLTIIISHSQFINNFALNDGGVLYAEDIVNISINNSVFLNNHCDSCAGGVVLIAEVDMVITNSQFTNNSGSKGGVIAAACRTRLVIEYSRFFNNSGEDGGVLYTQFSQITATIMYSDFIGNHATLRGGVVFADSADIYNNTIIIIFSSFKNNSADDGGSVYMNSKGFITVQNSSFDHNSVSGEGAVFYLYKSSKTKIYQIIFHGNTANKNGGVIKTFQTSIEIENGLCHNNSAMNDGGVISAFQSTSKIIRCSFESNYAYYDGGVISINEGVLNVSEGSTFLYNTAHNNGGVISAYQGHLFVSKSSTFSYNTAHNDGGVISTYRGVLNVTKGSTCSHNTAHNDGGVIAVYEGVLNVSEGSTFSLNTAHNDGGVVHAYEAVTTIVGNSYNGNRAGNRGGVWFVYQGNLTIFQSIASHNEATDVGGAMYSDQGDITIRNTSSFGNTATEGGALYTHQDNVFISYSSFSLNLVDKNGGAWFMKDCQTVLQDVNFASNSADDGGAVYSSGSTLSLSSCVFVNNSAMNKGGALFSSQSKISSVKSLNVTTNRASLGVTYLLGSTAHFDGQTLVSKNTGSFLMINSRITFTGTTQFIGGSESMRSHDLIVDLHEGGALTAYKSDIILNGTSGLTENCAENGGAIHATDQSKVYLNGETTIAYNTANNTGGGIYLDTSELQCHSNSSLTMSRNNADKKGGGVHAISSSINVIGTYEKNRTDLYNNTTYEYVGSILYISDNEAKKGGGLYLEMNSKLYVLKFTSHNEPFSIVTFSGNSADYGGAVYVSDYSNLGTCNPSFSSQYEARECFFQVLAIYSSTPSNVSQVEGNVNALNIHFSQNHAHTSGSSLFGGLVDRCKIQHFSELQEFIPHTSVPRNINTVNGISYMSNISNINMSEISSEPVQLCFCKGGIPDCNYQPDPIRVIKGKKFFVKIVAVDQVGHYIDAKIHSQLLRTGGGLGSGQENQNTNKTCTDLNFNLFSPNDKEVLVMYAEGPCQSSPQSQRRLSIQFTACDSCPIGFERHTDEDTSCQCICDSRLEPYITECNASTELLLREGDFWITYISGSDNATSGYLIYAHCPLNYCKPPTAKVEVNLNIPGGADVQCVDGHSGILCGSCLSNLSLSLGSSRCIPCWTNWTRIATILVATIFAGVCLVTLLLVFNITVAVGTIQGIVLYANIVASSSSTFLPFSKPNFATVFISWLNLEIGFDVCFFDRIDAYWKTLLQLAFPIYIIFLVVMVIFISERWTKFARLLAKRNPVATLATLILLSYTKFLNTIIASLSYATLIYPNGSGQWVWLPDATVEYLKGKHIVLFTIALLILLAGVVYTGLLFSWQWLLLHQDKNIFLKWLTKNQKLRQFIESYHAPYTFEQRYWIGLLLFVRVILYVIAATTGDPQISLVSINILFGILFLLKASFEKKVHKQRAFDVMETIMFFNVISFSAVTSTTWTTNNQTIVAFTSVLITIICLLIVILFHMYRYSGLLSATKQIIAFIIHISNCRKKYQSLTNGARLPEVEDDQPLITHTIVELPSHHRHLESQQRNSADLRSDSADTEGTADSPTFSPHVAIADNDITTTSAAQLACEEFGVN